MDGQTSTTIDSDPPVQRGVLLLDDDRDFLSLFAELAGVWCGDTWKIHPAANSAQALGILQENAIELAIVDVHLPVVDGIQFIRQLTQKYPELRVAVLTGLADDAKRAECLSLGVGLFLEKPTAQQDYETLFAMLRGLLDQPKEKGFRGLLKSVGLEDILQMECLARKSSVLEVANKRLGGRIYLEQGSVIHATAGSLKGESAFNELFALEGGDFRILPFDAPPERTIQGQWEFLLMEAARLRDERVASQSSQSDAAALPDAAIEDVDAATETGAARRRPRRLDEIIFCSDQSTVEFQERCENPDKRIRLFGQVRPKIQMLTQLLRVGAFQQLEAEANDTRTVIMLTPARSLLVKVARPEDPAAPATE